MDTVVSGKGYKSCLLVLTERVSRKEIIKKIKDKSSKSVLCEIDKLKEHYKDRFTSIFKRITCDNRTEFSNCKYIENMGVKVFYAHNYCS